MQAYDIFINMSVEKEEPSDQSILEYIDTLQKAEVLIYHSTYEIQSLTHYINVQLEWILTARYFTGIRLGKFPSELELLDAWEANCNSERFRVFYILRYPNMVLKLENT